MATNHNYLMAMNIDANFGAGDDYINEQFNKDEDLLDSVMREPEIESDDFDENGIPNFAPFRIANNIPLETLLPESLYGIGGASKTPLGKKIQTYIKAFSRVPDGNTQYPLLASVLLQPSALAESQLPIVFFQGDSGTGKSDTIKLFSYLRGLNVEDGTDASIRDAISFGKFKKKGAGKFDDHYLLLTDNNGQDDLWRRPDFYRMLLKGYDRDTSRLSISGGKDNDQPLYFDCFCMKVMSSIFALDNDERFLEIKRRFLTFQFAKEHKVKALNPKGYDFTSVQVEIKKYWRHKPNLLRYRENAMLVRSKADQIIKEIGDQYYFLLVELIVTALTTGISDTVEEFVALLKIQLEHNSKRDKSDLEQFILDYLTLDEKSNPVKLIPTIAQVNLQNLLRSGVQEGSLDHLQIRPNFVKQVMTRLGYTKVKSKWVFGVKK